MISRRLFLQSAAVSVAYLASPINFAWAANAPGVSDAEIKIGQTMPYSGPASAYGTIGRAELAYFKMINEQGGINGRKLSLISVDDGYSPPKTVEQTRRLIEQERVAFMFGSLGTAPNAAVRSYLNENGIPQLLLASGASMFADLSHRGTRIREVHSRDAADRQDWRSLSKRRPRSRLPRRISRRRRARQDGDDRQGGLL
jgi:branched-chain amino acid transport system substrate-binding protein